MPTVNRPDTAIRYVATPPSSTRVPASSIVNVPSRWTTVVAAPKSCDHDTGGPPGGLHERSIAGSTSPESVSTRGHEKGHGLALRRPASVQTGNDGTWGRRQLLRRREAHRFTVSEHDVSAVCQDRVPPRATAGDVTDAVPDEEPVCAGAPVEHIPPRAAREDVVAREPEHPVVARSSRDAVGPGRSSDDLGSVRADDARGGRRERDDEARRGNSQEGLPHGARSMLLLPLYRPPHRAPELACRGCAGGSHSRSRRSSWRSSLSQPLPARASS